MSHLVRDPVEFKRLRDLARSHLKAGIDLPSQVFASRYTHFALCDDTLAISAELFERLASRSPNHSSRRLVFVTLDPDPITYYEHHFGTYGCVAIPLSAPLDGYVNSLMEDPGDSPADALLFRADEAILFVEGGEFVGYFNRGYEVFVAAFEAAGFRDEFIRGFMDFGLAPASEAVNGSLSAVCESLNQQGVDFGDRLKLNYP